MSSETTPADLLDLKMLPAWASEAARPNDYADFQGEEFSPNDRRDRGRDDRRERRPRPPQSREGGRDRKDRRPRPEQRRDDDRPQQVYRERPQVALPAVAVRFLPRPPAFANVAEQIKTGSVAYSVFALARLFLDKPERYNVRLQPSEGTTLYQLGEDGPVAADRSILESSAFAQTRNDFFAVETTQTEPLKGNFTNVARCRLSGILLGPTNHHAYQPQLRNLYEQRFSRRMSFADYQRQIDVVSDPAAIEQWKEQARSVTTFTTKKDEPATTFASLAEAERHFRQKYLPELVRQVAEVTIDGVVSRELSDRGLGRVIEDAWSAEIRSPSKMMQELAGGLRQAGLNIFRHRKGMLYVSPIRARVFSHEQASVSGTINALLEKVGATPGITRKQLAEQLAPAEGEAADLERAKRTLVTDLRWLISEGYVIEFNDGSLDLPRPKAPAAPPNNGHVAAIVPAQTETPAEVSPGDQPAAARETADSSSDESESQQQRADAQPRSADQPAESALPVEPAGRETGEQAS